MTKYVIISLLVLTLFILFYKIVLPIVSRKLNEAKRHCSYCNEEETNYSLIKNIFKMKLLKKQHCPDGWVLYDWGDLKCDECTKYDDETEKSKNKIFEFANNLNLNDANMEILNWLIDNVTKITLIEYETTDADGYDVAQNYWRIPCPHLVVEVSSNIQWDTPYVHPDIIIPFEKEYLSKIRVYENRLSLGSSREISTIGEFGHEVYTVGADLNITIVNES